MLGSLPLRLYSELPRLQARGMFELEKFAGSWGGIVKRGGARHK